MNIFQIALLGIISAITIILLKDLKTDLAPFITLAFSIIVFMNLAKPLHDTVEVINEITVASGISSDITLSVLKVAGISLIVEFAAMLCNDAGQTSIGERIISSGKIIILALAMPIITELLKACFSVLR